MPDEVVTEIAKPARIDKGALLKAYLDELNVNLKVQQLFEDGQLVGQQIRLVDRPLAVEAYPAS